MRQEFKDGHHQLIHTIIIHTHKETHRLLQHTSLETKILREDMVENQHQTYQHVQKFYLYLYLYCMSQAKKSSGKIMQRIINPQY